MTSRSNHVVLLFESDGRRDRQERGFRVSYKFVVDEREKGRGGGGGKGGGGGRGRGGDGGVIDVINNDGENPLHVTMGTNSERKNNSNKSKVGLDYEDNKDLHIHMAERNHHKNNNNNHHNHKKSDKNINELDDDVTNTYGSRGTHESSELSNNKNNKIKEYYNNNNNNKKINSRDNKAYDNRLRKFIDNENKGNDMSKGIRHKNNNNSNINNNKDNNNNVYSSNKNDNNNKFLKTNNNINNFNKKNNNNENKNIFDFSRPFLSPSLPVASAKLHGGEQRFFLFLLFKKQLFRFFVKNKN